MEDEYLEDEGALRQNFTGFKLMVWARSFVRSFEGCCEDGWACSFGRNIARVIVVGTRFRRLESSDSPRLSVTMEFRVVCVRFLLAHRLQGVHQTGAGPHVVG